MVKIWNDRQVTEEINDSFSPNKLAFYFFQAICSLEFLHQQNLAVGDVRGPNIFVYRNQEVKIGDVD